MTFARFVLYCFGLVLLCLLGAGIYYYQNLPSLLAQQATVYLRDYGVQDMELGQLHLSGSQVTADSLWLRGEYDGMAFEAKLSSLVVNYNWRWLLNGQLQSVSLENLNLGVEQIAASSQPAADSISVQSLLPQPLIAQLPVKALTIKQWQLNYRAPAIPPIDASGNLLLAQRLSMQLQGAFLNTHISAEISTGDKQKSVSAQIELRDGESRITQLTAQLEPATSDEWQWTLQGTLYHAAIVAWLRRLDLEADLPLDTSTFEGLILRGDSTFNAQVTHPDKLKVSAEAGQTLLAQFNATINTVNDIAQLDFPGTIEGLTGSLAVAAQYGDEQLEIAIAPTELTGSVWAELLQLPEDSQRWLRWDKTVPLRWRNPELLEITHTRDNNWSLQLGDTLLVLGNKDSELRWEALNLDASLRWPEPPQEQLQIITTLKASLKTRLNKQQLPQLELAFTQHGSAENSGFTLFLRDTAESISLDLAGNINLNTGSGEYSLNARSLDLPYTASTLLPLLDKFDLLQQSVEISAGNITLNSKLKSGGFDIASWQQQSSLAIGNLSGSYDEYRFEGMTLAANWTGTELWKTQQSVEFSLAKLNVGFDLVDIQARVALPKATPIAQPIVNIEQFSAGMFGGRVYLPQPRQWDFGAPTNKLTLRAEQWQLADLVALQQDQDIRALGILEGELPVTLEDGRIIIEKGYLRALPPGGSIRYIANEASQALAASSPELGLALDLLSDFQYEVLSSEVELDREGNLLLGLSLAGKNPAQYEGRPINFNINLEQNLDPLLQSLRLSDKLVEKIEGRLH